MMFLPSEEGRCVLMIPCTWRCLTWLAGRRAMRMGDTAEIKDHLVINRRNVHR
jgi:hypothetical protein